MRICEIEGCDQKHESHGLCNKHSCQYRATLHPHRNRYRHMLARCYDESHPQYQDWGGRGIKVFHGWVDNYPAYAKYVNSLRKPSEKHNTLDRIDNDGDYEPGNLKWATRREQNINKRLYASNTSGLRGVHFNRSHKKWVVQFRVDGKVRAFGEFKTLSAAANKARSII